MFAVAFSLSPVVIPVVLSKTRFAFPFKVPASLKNTCVFEPRIVGNVATTPELLLTDNWSEVFINTVPLPATGFGIDPAAS